jgi:hypothetical protein
MSFCVAVVVAAAGFLFGMAAAKVAATRAFCADRLFLTDLL